MAVNVNVGDNVQDSTHHLSLKKADGTGEELGLIIPEGVGNIQQNPYSPSSLQFSTGRQGYGSFEPPYSSLDQVDWSGGMGQAYFKDPSKFLDSYNAWTLTEGMWLPAPMARNIRTARAENVYMPNSGELVTAGGESFKNVGVSYQTLSGTNSFLSAEFTTTEGYSVTEIWVIMKYFGAPPTLTCAIYSNNAGEPGSVITNGTINTSAGNLTDIMPEGESIGQWMCFHLDTAAALTNATVYHLVISNTPAGDPVANRWQLGTASNGTGYNSSESSDGSTWINPGGEHFYYRVLSLVPNAKMHFVEYKNALYACSEPADGTAGKIYLNGDRGVATGTSTANKLVDSTQSWSTDQWVNSYLHIWNGTGEGQYRRIVDNDGTSLTVYDSGESEGVGTGLPFDIVPIQGGTDTGSEYVIVGTAFWQDVTPTNSTFTITKPITDVLVLWGVMYCAQGEGANAAKLREFNDNGSPGVWKDFHGENANTHDTLVIDDANWKAQYLAKTYDPVNENFVWRARNQNPAEWTGTNQTSVSKADDVVWSANMSFGTAIPVGTRDHLITNIAVYNNKLFVGKENSLWYIEWDGSFDRAYPIQIGLEAMSEPDNNRAMVAKDLFLFFNWAHSVEKLYGSTLDDIGPWKGVGLPERARGPIVDLVPAIGWMLAAVDGGPSGQSSVLAYNDRGWHTLFRGPAKALSDFSRLSNPRIRSVHWQSVSGEYALNFLWFEMGGDIWFMRMPRKSLNPALESSMDVAFESFVTSSIHDAGYSALEKHFEGARIYMPGRDQVTVSLDYQTDVELAQVMGFKAGSDQTWTEVADPLTGGARPMEFDVSKSRKRNIVVRTRIRAENTTLNPVHSTKPPEGNSNDNGAGPLAIRAVVIDAFSRLPVKYNWTFPIRLENGGKTLTGAVDHLPEVLYDQLNTWAGQAQELTIASTNPYMNTKTVVIEPVPMNPDTWLKRDGVVEAAVTVTLRET